MYLGSNMDSSHKERLFQKQKQWPQWKVFLFSIGFVFAKSRDQIDIQSIHEIKFWSFLGDSLQLESMMQKNDRLRILWENKDKRKKFHEIYQLKVKEGFLKSFAKRSLNLVEDFEMSVFDLYKSKKILRSMS